LWFFWFGGLGFSTPAAVVPEVMKHCLGGNVGNIFWFKCNVDVSVDLLILLIHANY